MEPIVQSAHKHNKPSLLDIAGDVKDDRVLPHLRAELQNSDRDMRIAAAWGLSRHGQEDGVQALLKEWQGIPWDEPMYSAGEDRVRRLVSCLASCGEPRAIQALTGGFAQKPPRVQCEILEACRAIEQDCRGRPLSAAVQAAMEELLALALTNTEPWPFTRYSGDKGTRGDTTIGDVAAEVLVQRWGKPQLFDIYETFGAPRPPAVRVEERLVEKVRQAAQTVAGRNRPAAGRPCRPLAASGPPGGDGRSATRRGSSHGRPGPGRPARGTEVPAQRAAPGDPARAPLESSMCRMALTIAEVRFSEDSFVPSGELRQRASACAERPWPAID